MTAKIRPAVVINTPFHDNERALFAMIPHTTALRGGRFEVEIKVPWLEHGAFDVQGTRPVPSSVLIRKLGALNSGQMETILQALKVWLEIS